jgi:hypothetical protein
MIVAAFPIDFVTSVSPSLYIPTVSTIKDRIKRTAAVVVTTMLVATTAAPIVTMLVAAATAIVTSMIFATTAPIVMSAATPATWTSCARNL